MQKERPIIFSGPMIQAILNGTKSQTRRVIKPQPGRDARPEVVGTDHKFWWRVGYYHEFRRCPFGVPGDALYVREMWATRREWDHMKPSDLPADADLWWRADKSSYRALNAKPGKWRPSIHMPKKFARIWLEITGVRAEQLQKIAAKDIIAEGVDTPFIFFDWNRNNPSDVNRIATRFGELLHIAFAVLWDSLNAKRGFGFDTNPWGWALTFTVKT